MANASSIEDPAAGKAALLKQTTRIAAAYMVNNQVPASDIAALLHTVHSTLVTLGQPMQTEAPAPLTPAVPIRKSVTPEYIVCLEDGKRIEFIPIRPLAARDSGAPGSYAGHLKDPLIFPALPQG